MARRILVAAVPAAILTLGAVAPSMAAPGGQQKGSGSGSTKTINGTYSGTSTAVSSQTDTCDPQAPTSPGDLLCDFSTAGTYSDGYLGNPGTYSGSIVLDWSTYTNSHPCASASGMVTYSTGSGKNAGSVTLQLDPAQSTVCETADPTVHSTNFVENQIVYHTGRFSTMTAANITSAGTSSGASSPYTDAGTLTGTVSYS